MKLDPNRRERYSRMLALRNFSEDDMETLMQTTVTVVGAGGLGSPALRLLTALGFGSIRIIDRDIVELSNIQRQTVYNTDDIGRPKAEAAADNLKRLNPDVHFEPMCTSVEEGTALSLLGGSDIVIDGLDSFTSRRHVNKAILKLGIPYVFAGAVEYYANLSTIVPNSTGCLHCIIGDAKDNPESSCANIGVDPTVLSTAASIEVREAILLATDRPPKLADKLMTIDLDSLSFDFFEVKRSKECPECSGKTSTTDVFHKSTLSVNQLCVGNYSVSPSEAASLSLDKITSKLQGKFEIRRRKRSLTIIFDSEKSMTLMRSGSAVIKGVGSPDEARALYFEILDN